jgi:hypothetical protein
MDRKLALADYRSLRATGLKVSQKLVKSLLRDDILTAARRLGMVRGKNTVYFNTEDESSVLMDYAIHEIVHDGQNAIDRMLAANSLAEGSAELRFLRSLRTAHYTILEVTQALPGFGVIANDEFRNAIVSLVDVGFSQTANPGAMMAGRVHSPGDGWWMTTGACLPVVPEAMDRIADGIEAHRDRHGKEADGRDLALFVTRACLKAGASQYIEYGEVGESTRRAATREPIARPVRAGTKVGRNDACPCGSGKKYKKCCGMGAA